MAVEDWGLIVGNKRIILASEFMSELGLELGNYWAGLSVSSVSLKGSCAEENLQEYPI